MAGGRAPDTRGSAESRPAWIVQLRPSATVEVRAAGGVVWRPIHGGERVYAIVHRPAYDDWTLPKGKLMAGESELEGALREAPSAPPATSTARAGPRSSCTG